MTVVQLPSLRVSFLPYADAETAKYKKNKMFQLNNPQINKKIQFTNLIELKEELVDTFLNEIEDPYLELYSVAHGWVLFERLVYKNVVKSHNRSQYLAACVKISVKLYECFGDLENYTEKLQSLNNDLLKFIDKMNDKSDFEIKELSSYEQRVMFALHFQPRVPPMLVQPHLDSIQVMCDKTLEDFLGCEDYKNYSERIKAKMK